MRRVLVAVEYLISFVLTALFVNHIWRVGFELEVFGINVAGDSPGVHV